MDFRKKFVVKEEDRIELSTIDAENTEGLKSKEVEQDQLQFSQRLQELQFLMYAENKRSLLIVLQAMDAAGKDGAIRHVFGVMNPQGCRVQPFKAPSSRELAHDFLWRVHQVVPERGQITVFNRSHYEDVLVVRVHNLVAPEVWKKRFEQINQFESLLATNNTTILKFFLHISPDEQLKRFRQRLEDPNRNWKISEADYRERQYWNEYQQAYEEVFARCSKNHAPWYIIPANNKWFRNLAISQIVADTMGELDMRFPAPTIDLEVVRQQFHEAKKAARESRKNSKD